MLVQEVYNSISDGVINFGYKHITQSFKPLRNIIICSVGEKTGETLVEALSLRPRIQLALLRVYLEPQKNLVYRSSFFKSIPESNCLKSLLLTTNN